MPILNRALPFFLFASLIASFHCVAQIEFEMTGKRIIVHLGKNNLTLVSTPPHIKPHYHIPTSSQQSAKVEHESDSVTLSFNDIAVEQSATLSLPVRSNVTLIGHNITVHSDTLLGQIVLDQKSGTVQMAQQSGLLEVQSDGTALTKRTISGNVTIAYSMAPHHSVSVETQAGVAPSDTDALGNNATIIIHNDRAILVDIHPFSGEARRLNQL